MAVIIILIAISLSIAVLFLTIFYWNMKSGQYEDTYTPSVRILFDNKAKTEKQNGAREYSSMSDGGEKRKIMQPAQQAASDPTINSDR